MEYIPTRALFRSQTLNLAYRPVEHPEHTAEKTVVDRIKKKIGAVGRFST